MANELIIGTAGHVDHGKTTLIKALTGKDTDRLLEEKKRGISIELGFAHFLLPSGKRAGIVDVPGHERFLRNMLAGVGGMDLVLLVIAADEGVMPQTTEHMEILQLLGVTEGIVVLTKSDTVDAEWLDLVEEDVKTFLAGTVLENAPVCRVASIRGQGIPELIQLIDAKAELLKARSQTGAFRMPIDRVFTMPGFGTIVTGTLWTGMIQEGDRAVIEPGGLEVRIRGIQVYGKKAATARAGQRTALNIPGIECADLDRGHVIVKPGALKPGHILNAKFLLLKQASIKELQNGTRVRCYTGTAEAIGRIYILDNEKLLPGDTALVQIRLENSVAAAYGDNYVIRLYSPMQTIGGGTLLEVETVKGRRFDAKLLKRLTEKAAGKPEALTYQMLAGAKGMLTAADLQRGLGQFTLAQITEFLILLMEADRVGKWDIDGTEYYLDKEAEVTWLEEIRKHLTIYHQNHGLRIGVPREELRQRYLTDLTPKQVQALFSWWQQAGVLSTDGQKVHLPTHKVIFKGLHQQWREKIEHEFMNNLFSPPDITTIIPVGKGKNKEAVEVWESLLEQGIIVHAGEGIYFHQDAIVKTRELIKQYFTAHERLIPADFRTLIGSSRKYCMPLLEYFDGIGVTKRLNEYRVLVHE